MTTRPARPIGLAFTLAFVAITTGCLSASPIQTTAAPSPEFRPELFFAGATHGDGTLSQRGKAARRLTVEGHGVTEADGSFRLDQGVTYADGSKEKRTWHLKRTGAHTYSATLSDASGNVSGETVGNEFRLRYLVRQPAVYMNQRIFLQPDGRTALNVATVTVLGIPWVRLSETITRVGSE
ncbi:MAG: DUF3833 domain-containing protein [Gemmatimonadota bacterium]|nr:DUF3833 domain-containing protein [Gemmatimonadota bacterium]